ncbi:MAG: tripartite tricarboxylate transporter TctB family protein [Deltaproteobacteria bacterium]|nr:tripartite tricarboxylate transporter TctB family protein [Deltaproteobacteria bacterium]
MEYKKRETITAIAILIVALILIFYVIPNFIELDEEYELASLYPDFFPRLAVWAIGILAALHVVVTLLRKDRLTGGKWLTSGEELNVYKSFLVVIGYYFVMKYFGFLISTAMMLAVLFVLQGFRKPIKVALLTTLTTVGVYLFFLHVMHVHFPKGLLFE